MKFLLLQRLIAFKNVAELLKLSFSNKPVSNESGVFIFTFLHLTGTTFPDTGSPYQLTIPVQIQRQTPTVSPPRLAFLAWGDFHARSRFARSTIREGKWGTTRSLSNSPLLTIPFARVNCPTPKAQAMVKRPGLARGRMLNWVWSAHYFEEQQNRQASRMP